MADYLLDTNVLILALRGRHVALDLLDVLQRQATLHISVVTRTEVLAGMHPREETRTLHLLQSLESLPITLAIADRAGRWIYQFARQGVQLSFPDALIGATAVRHDLALVTTNTKHFPMSEVQTYPLAT